MEWYVVCWLSWVVFLGVSGAFLVLCCIVSSGGNVPLWVGCFSAFSLVGLSIHKNNIRNFMTFSILARIVFLLWRELSTCLVMMFTKFGGRILKIDFQGRKYVMFLVPKMYEKKCFSVNVCAISNLTTDSNSACLQTLDCTIWLLELAQEWIFNPNPNGILSQGRKQP